MRLTNLVILAAALPAATSYSQSNLPAQEVNQAAAGNAVAAARLVDEIKSQMVPIPAGQFQMGSSENAGEKPIHRVTVKAFLLGKYEVTFDQYDAFVKLTGRASPEATTDGRGDRPVVNVNWDDAQAFITWLNQVGGLKFRLPAEAEWEYAARAGSGADYPWGKDFDANRVNGSGKSDADQWFVTAPVGSFSANAFGLHDMIGNVWEWTADCWNRSYEGAPSDGSVWNAGDCARRVLRGGSWFDGPTGGLRVSFRFWDDPADRNFSLGFRLAQDP